MTPSASPRCLRHSKVMASCPDCTAALRARITAERGTTILTGGEPHTFAVAA